MRRHRVLLLLALAGTGCGLITPSKTSGEDKELTAFGEARQRAATYYDGGEYVRAAAQYKVALDIRSEHFMTQLGYAYSLTNTRYAPNIVLALKYFEEEMGPQSDLKREVRRAFGMAEAHRLLGMYHRRRARELEDKGIIDEAANEEKEAIRSAQNGVDAYDRVLEIDKKLESRSMSEPFRVSGSLAPMARIGIAVCCITLGSRENPGPIERAVDEVNMYAQVARNARKFWTMKREQKMDLEPLKSMVEGSAKQMQTVEARRRYDELIKGTVEKEAIVRRGLVEFYMNELDRFEDAIAECTRILELDPDQSVALFYRARCYTLLKPPQYEHALEDMREYRSRQDLTRLTQEVIRINQLIKMYEARLKEQKKEDALDLG